MNQELKRSIIMASFATVLLVIVGVGVSIIIGLAVAPEQAKLAPKQLEDNAEAYQVARGANIGVIRTWIFIGGGLFALLIWGTVLVRYLLTKDEDEETPLEGATDNG